MLEAAAQRNKAKVTNPQRDGLQVTVTNCALTPPAHHW